MIKKFLTVLVLGLAVFAVSCSKDDVEVSKGDVDGVIASLTDSIDVAFDSTTITSKELAESAVKDKINAIVGTVKGLEATITLATSGTVAATPAAGETVVVSEVELAVTSGYVFASDVTDSSKKTGSLTSTLCTVLTKEVVATAVAAINALDDDQGTDDAPYGLTVNEKGNGAGLYTELETALGSSSGDANLTDNDFITAKVAYPTDDDIVVTDEDGNVIANSSSQTLGAGDVYTVPVTLKPVTGNIFPTDTATDQASFTVEVADSSE